MNDFIEVTSRDQRVKIRKDSIVAVIEMPDKNSVVVKLAGTEFAVTVSQPYDQFIAWLQKELEK